MTLHTIARTATTPTIWLCRMCGRQQAAGALMPRACRYCKASAFEDDGRCWQWDECPGMRTGPHQRVCPLCHTGPMTRARSRL